MTAPIVIATLEKNTRERVRVALDEFQDHQLIDVRILAQLTETSDAWFPTNKGVSLKINLLPGLVRALQEAEAKAIELGLIGADR
jgi:hypothetical protein